MSTLRVTTAGKASETVASHLPTLVEEGVASGIAAGDFTLWGDEAESESRIRLGWVKADQVSRPLVSEILDLRASLLAAGVDRFVLCGMGGSSLAPEVIASTAGVALTVLDSTHPDQVRDAVSESPERTAIIVSSKSGSTVETDSQKRAFEAVFRDAGIDPIERVIIVTDPGSPLDERCRAAGYRVFNADPQVGGRFSALTAFGLVPSGLAGVDIERLLDEAAGAAQSLAADSESNPALILGAAIAGAAPARNKLALVPDTTPITGLPDWAEQLIAESTGKEDQGILPLALTTASFEAVTELDDVQVVRLVAEAGQPTANDVQVSGSLGAQFLLWEYATAVAGRIIGINPFDQPDVESAKIAARKMLSDPPEAEQPAFVEGNVAVSGSEQLVAGVDTVSQALSKLLSVVPPDGYVSIQAYASRHEDGSPERLRNLIATTAARPTTFGWGPRFLHSTGQFHKGGPKVGVFLQIIETATEDLAITDMPFTFGELIAAQAAGDAEVLSAHGMPVLSLTVSGAKTVIADLVTVVEQIG